MACSDMISRILSISKDAGVDFCFGYMKYSENWPWSSHVSVLGFEVGIWHLAT